MQLKGPQEMQDWARHPGTLRLLEVLKETVLEGQQSWLNRELERPAAHDWAVVNSAALAVAGYAEALRLEIEDLTKEEVDAE